MVLKTWVVDISKRKRMVVIRCFYLRVLFDSAMPCKYVVVVVTSTFYTKNCGFEKECVFDIHELLSTPQEGQLMTRMTQ